MTADVNARVREVEMPSLKVGLELLFFPAWRNDQNLRVKVSPLVMGRESWGERQPNVFQRKAFLNLHQLNAICAH